MRCRALSEPPAEAQPAIAASPRAARTRRLEPRRVLALDDAILLRAQTPDAHLDGVPGGQVAGRLHAVRDAGRRAGGDDGAGPERHEPAHVADQMPHAEDHAGGRALLTCLTVDGGPHLERLWVAR